MQLLQVLTQLNLSLLSRVFVKLRCFSQQGVTWLVGTHSATPTGMTPLYMDQLLWMVCKYSLSAKEGGCFQMLWKKLHGSAVSLLPSVGYFGYPVWLTSCASPMSLLYKGLCSACVIKKKKNKKPLVDLNCNSCFKILLLNVSFLLLHCFLFVHTFYRVCKVVCKCYPAPIIHYCSGLWKWGERNSIFC